LIANYNFIHRRVALPCNAFRVRPIINVYFKFKVEVNTVSSFGICGIVIVGNSAVGNLVVSQVQEVLITPC